MNCSPRLNQILQVLLKSDSVISVNQLAQDVGVSKRTVQRELEYIDIFLKKFSLKFLSKTGKGVWIEGEQDDKDQLLKLLLENRQIDITDREERRKRLTLEMLKDKAPKKLYYFSDLFGVSEATISNDMEELGQWFAQFHLVIQRKQGYGVTLVGSEQDYRKALRSFIDQNMDSKMIRDIYEGKDPNYLRMSIKTNEKNIYDILDDSILRRVLNCVLSLQEKRIGAMTENSFIGFILHITIAMNRILKKEIIESNEELINSLQEDEDYELAKYIVESLEEEFETQIPKMEIIYICLHIKASKSQYVEPQKNTSFLYHEGIVEILEEMIDAYDGKLAPVLKQDEEFISGLLAHLQPTFVRLKNKMSIGNPLLPEIKKDYASIYLRCVEVSKVIEKHLNCQVPETEIGFLTIHFGAAIVRLENQKESKRKVKIGIVCASGIGISRLMLTKLSRYLKDRAEITTYGNEDITPYITEKNDFFVSSISIQIENADVLYVSPLLVEEDLERIEKKVKLYERIPKKQEVENEFSLQLEQVNYLAVQIKNLLNEVQCIKVNHQVTFEELLEIISQKLTPYKESQLKIQEDIQRRENLASQIMPELEIALLHTRTTGVVHPNFSVCYTREGDPFSDAYFNGIQVVIVMLIPLDSHVQDNSELLGYLSTSLIEEEQFLEKILEGEIESVKAELAKVLKKYFNQYLERV